MREEIETWMKENEILILAIQETILKTNQKEARKEYTWFISGEQKTTKTRSTQRVLVL